MQKLVGRLFSIFAFSLVCPPVSAVVIRHDVADAKYLELATNVPAPVILLRNEMGSADGMGTWIAPNWVLTAAHVAESFTVGDKIGGKQQYRVEEIVMHPDWQNAPIDVALVKVAQKAEDGRLIAVCAAEDAQGQTVTIVGAGDTGDGRVGPVHGDGKMRAARNIISSVGEHFVAFVFDPPGSPSALDMEGVSGPGDSGGPAYLSTDEGFCVLAVSSGQDTDSTGGLEGRYGVVEYYSRVDVLGDWIREVTER